ncbi:hypothetical protein PAXRUDRAFT_174435 [Paxillus rubicundulus Ve08.2h10]|uniref:Unplaced genomic scaffold scaffold_3681, whole genome shotgun sequence n=1 Tax=Paxillus rubicundulus Ve08.2h10 TaxID=930991 RepID=A0A0D0BTV7_9AGAM|nr:hypothetical protein PAXRUDRAFT_174435 [Paxillus rubicundulus Ve08.2h10]
MDLDNEPTADPAAWDILIAFANGTINSLPEAEKRLTEHLEKAITHHTGPPVPPSTRQSRCPSLPELERAEAELMQAVDSLSEWKCI